MQRAFTPTSLAALLASASLIAGCSTMPRERPVAPPLPSAWPAAAPPPASPATLTNWWNGFGDPTLDRLVDEGLERSPSVRLSYLRLKEARGQSRQTFGAFLPELNGAGRAQYTRSINGPGLFGSTLGGVGGATTFTPEKEQAIGSYGATVSWEIPLFARLEAAAIGARANNRAAVEDVRGSPTPMSICAPRKTGSRRCKRRPRTPSNSPASYKSARTPASPHLPTPPTRAVRRRARKPRLLMSKSPSE
jgi:hypothetical protein